MPRLRPLACVLTSILALGCTTSVNPATGRREVVMMTPEDEQRIDEQAVREIRSSVGIIADPELTEYVAEMGRTLAVHSPRQDVDYHFQIVEMDEPNAFALPGGHIFVSRGLLVLANTEAEVAHVLGHEIGHVAGRHSAKIQAHVNTLGLATLLGDLMSGGSEETHESENIAGDPIARYARAQERQADQIGQDIAVQSGVAPDGMARFLTSLDNYTKLSQGFSMPQTYFATEAWKEKPADATLGSRHPSYTEARDAYLDRIDGMAVTRPASEGVILEDRFLHLDLDFALRFPHGWTPHNEPERVFAVSPKGDGVVILELQGSGNDPVAAARAFAESEHIVLRQGTPVRIGELYGFRAVTVVPTGNTAMNAEITWVAHGGRVYRLIGGMGGGQLRKYQGLFRKFSQSFRPLSPEEADSIEDLRLRTVRAREGETLAMLSGRAGNQWDLTYTSVVNNLFTHDPLAEGQRVKVAVKEPYVAKPPAAAGETSEPETPVER
jgi:predicted Zn-dependent protease